MRTAYLKWEHSTLMDGRVRVPARWRQDAQRPNDQTQYLAHGLGGCVSVFSKEVWQAHVAKFNKLIAVLPAQQAGHLRQCFLSEAVTLVRPDAAGRIHVPPALIAFARLQRSVVLVQWAGRMEIWGQGQWAAQLHRYGVIGNA